MTLQEIYTDLLVKMWALRGLRKTRAYRGENGYRETKEYLEYLDVLRVYEKAYRKGDQS